MSALYTAAQIARALGKKRQAVQQLLSDVIPCGKIISGGNEANAWSFSKLPHLIQNALHLKAERRNYRNAETLLQVPCKRWEPPLPVSEIAQSNLDKAVKLQKALRPILEKQGSAKSAKDLEQLGLLEYRKVFGHEISDRHWRRLFLRTIERDNGAEEWSRLEIYLDENPARKKAAVTERTESDIESLRQAIANFQNPTVPTESEKDYLWLRSIDFYEDKLSQGKTSKQAKRLLFAFLNRHASFLAPTRDALLKAFNRRVEKLQRNEGKIEALKDQRGAKPISFPADDIDKIIFHARWNCGGRISQAWRELCERNELSEATLRRYIQNPTSKSHVPRTIRDLTTHETRLLEDIHHGPRQAKLNGAFISRDWSSVRGGDWWNADDCTLPIYYYVPDGKGWFTLMRGQFLLMIDLRTTQILGFALQSERNYNARVIRTLITRVCDNHHLPRKGFYFENGIWRNSKILKGDSDADAALPWSEAELGLREFGLKFVHAKLPRAKPIEGVLGKMQNLMEGDPGYAGRDERHDRFERFQKLKLEVERKKTHPASHFYDAEQWENRLHQLCEQYNAARQTGKMTDGLSPNDAMKKFNTLTDPPVCVDSTWRYLLAHHKRPIRVTGNGITLRFGKQVFNYKSEATGKLVGQTVIAWFDPELPEIITITDKDRKNPVCISRSQEVPAMEAAPEILNQELARIEAHQSHAKVRYRILQKKYATFVRPNFVSPEVLEVGRAIERQTSRLQEQTKTQNRQLQKAQKVYSNLGATIPKQLRAEQIEAAERLQEFLNEEET